MSLDPAGAGKRAEKARGDRQIHVTGRDDGMARFSADLAAPVALLAHEVIDTVARGMDTGCRAGRSLPQTRADVFADIVVALAADGAVDLRGGRPGARGPRLPATTGGNRADVPETRVPGPGVAESADTACGAWLPPRWDEIGGSVSVIVDAGAGGRACSPDPDVITADANAEFDAAAAGPAFLEGHGWIPADLGRALATSARRARVIVRRHGGTDVAGMAPVFGGAPPPTPPDDPVADHPDHSGHPAASRWCGTEYDHGTRVYRSPARLDELVRQRDRVCRFPGCRRAARFCDLDHRVPFDGGGPTCPCNLDALCRSHHRLKTFTDWLAVRVPGDRLLWTSPLGGRHLVEPEPLPGADDPPPF